MTCGVTLRRAPRRTPSSQIDAEVADILRRVFSVEPVSWEGELWVPSGPADAIERLRASVAEIRKQSLAEPLALNASQPAEPLVDWLATFVRAHQHHER